MNQWISDDVMQKIEEAKMEIPIGYKITVDMISPNPKNDEYNRTIEKEIYSQIVETIDITKIINAVNGK